MGTWNILKKLFPLIGISIFIYLILKLDIKNISQTILNANLGFLVIVILLVILSVSLQTLKWWIIALNQEMNIPFKKAVKINLMSDFYGFVTPSKLGTIMRVEYLKKYGTVGRGITNFTLDKILDICSLFFLSLLFIFVFKGIFPIYFRMLMFGIVILIVLIFLFLKERAILSILKWMYNNFLPKKFKLKAKSTFHALYENFPKKSVLIQALLLNTITWIVAYFISYFIGLSLGINVHWIYFLAIFPIATLIAQLPITVNGLGTREAVLIQLFGLLNVEATKVFSMSILGLLIAGIVPVMVGLFFILKGENKKNEIHPI